MSDMNTGAAAPQDERALFEKSMALAGWKFGLSQRDDEVCLLAWTLGRAALPAQAVAASVDPRTPSDTSVNGGALTLALAALRRAGKTEIADELEKTAVRMAAPVQDVAPSDAREQLRREQAEAVMPLVGPLLDAWDGASHDDRAAMTECGVGTHIIAIYRAMTEDQPAARAEQPAAQPADARGLPIEQEPKYTTDGQHIINRASGEAIPADEPIFIFRARDKHAREALEAYACVLLPGLHRDVVAQRIADFAGFSYQHPERMKEPDTAALAARTQEGAAS